MGDYAIQDFEEVCNNYFYWVLVLVEDIHKQVQVADNCIYRCCWRVLFLDNFPCQEVHTLGTVHSVAVQQVAMAAVQVCYTVEHTLLVQSKEALPNYSEVKVLFESALASADTREYSLPLYLNNQIRLLAQSVVAAERQTIYYHKLLLD